MAKSYAWYVCRACRSRLAVEREFTGEIRCRNCSTLIRAAAAAATSPAGGDDDEYRLAPAEVDRRPGSALSHPATTPPPIDPSHLEKLRTARDRARASVPSVVDSASTSDASLLDRFAPRDDQRYAPAPPPRWAFFSGVLTYPWWPQSVLPWVVLTVSISLCEVARLWIVDLLGRGQLIAGFFALGWLFFALLTGSYAAACIAAVTETTAYNDDAPYDWPDPDWRERVMHLVWLGWCVGLAAALALGPATALFESAQHVAWALLIGVGVLFPIFLLSTLETNSLSPFSQPVWGSLLTQGLSWLIFYALTGLLVGGCGFASVWLFGRIGMFSAFVAGPLWAACILIYARLLGRLAWQIMQPSQAQLQAWRKTRQSTLAGDERQRRREEETFEEESPA
jgi:hypothetical protein